MRTTRVAKLFKNGASQAVRLPAGFRFKGDRVYATRDETTGAVVLSDQPGAAAWGDFFELLRSTDIPDDFLAERPLNKPPAERDLFANRR